MRKVVARPRVSGPGSGGRVVVALCASAFVVAAAGCKSASDSGGLGSGGAKTSGSGGSSASGGATSSGGASQLGSGGSSSSGGATSTGGNTGSGATSTGGTSGSGGTTGGSGGSISIDDAGVTDAACQMASYMFAPTFPTVYLMVDRSGSMFDCLSTTNLVEPSCPNPADTSWAKLRDATLSVVTSLQTQVRFGFASFTGTNPANGGTCPMIDQVAPALNNFMPISDVYTKLPFQPNTTQSGMKFETPARQALDMIGAKLLADTSPGGKYILFVTDGEPDYCDDANPLCAPDSVIGGLQDLKAKGITTIVIGLQSISNTLPPTTLQGFANAGAGEPTKMPLPATGDMYTLWDQCNGLPPWKADFAATAKMPVRGATVGTYAATAGPTKPYTPAAGDQAMLVSQLTTALSGVKSCTFDLGNINGQSIKVDPNQLGAAHICLDKTCPSTKEVAQDATNGWSMASATQVILNGTSCTNWRMPNNNDISFDFPCKSIIFE